jgi:hypothetical protein
MNHKQYMQTVKEYRERSGHAINYYDGGAENQSPVVRSGSPYLGKREQKGSLAKDDMRKIHGRSDSKSNYNSKRKIDLAIINDVR